MSDIATKIKESLGRSLQVGVSEIFDGFVAKVDEENYLVDVRINGDGEDSVVLPGIALRSVSDGDRDGFICVPAKGSHVVFCKIDGQGDYVLLKTSKLDKVVIDVETVKVVASKDGLELSKGNISLKTLLSDLASLLRKFKVTTPTGPSTAVLPDTLASIVDFENKFNTLLNA